jgi:adenylate kinase
MLGAPGSGKGTQGDKLVALYGIPRISTGDLLRAEVAAGSTLGLKAKAAMDAGELVSDDIVIGMVETRLAQPDVHKGFILDGFPRSLTQAMTLDAMLDRINHPITHVIHLKVEDAHIVERLMSRGRADDQEDVIRHRLSVYHNQTYPLLDYYHAQHKLATVPGVGSLEAIFTAITDVI